MNAAIAEESQKYIFRLVFTRPELLEKITRQNANIACSWSPEIIFLRDFYRSRSLSLLVFVYEFKHKQIVQCSFMSVRVALGIVCTVFMGDMLMLMLCDEIHSFTHFVAGISEITICIFRSANLHWLVNSFSVRSWQFVAVVVIVAGDVGRVGRVSKEMCVFLCHTISNEKPSRFAETHNKCE